MKILKRIIIVLAVIIAIPLIVALFVKKEYAVEREITISRPGNEVFDYIKYLQNQDNFSVWANRDPNMKKSFKGTDGTVGCIAYWESDNKEVGKGEQEIKKIIEGSRIDTEIRFKIPFESTDDAYMITESKGANSTRVKWGFKGSFPYPMNLMTLFIDMDKELGKDLEQGLENLRIILEKDSGR